jgi:hypothetical protein
LKVKESLRNRPLDELKTVDKTAYSGFVMFDIFEQLYLQPLMNFMEQRSPKLFSLLLLRHKSEIFAERAEELMSIEVPRSKLNDSVKALSSLALANSQRFTESHY